MLAKFPWEAFYDVFLSFSMKLIWKMSPRVLCKILGVLLTHWLPMASIMFKVVRICNSQLKCNYLKKEKLFLDFFFHFWIVHQILKTLKEKMIVIANIFLKLQTVKISLEISLKSTVSAQALAVNMWKHRKWLLNFHERPFITFFLSFSLKLIWKISPLVLSEILGVFLNT